MNFLYLLKEKIEKCTNDATIMVIDKADGSGMIAFYVLTFQHLCESFIFCSFNF